MRPATSTSNYYPALDGLRGVAILMVVFHHNFRFLNYFFFGWLGVDLFFVLSGFLITEILLNKMKQPRFLQNFYMRRVLRIFPIYYLLLIICLFVLPNINSLNLDMDYYIHNQIWQWSYLQNWLYIFREPAGDQLLLHTWSLAVEEQFYLIWPFVILLFKRPRVLLAVVVTVLFLVGLTRYILWEYNIKDLAYASLYLFTRIDGLCIGAMLAILMYMNPGSIKRFITIVVLLLAAMNFGFYFINTRHFFQLPYLAFVGYTTFAMLFGILVYYGVTGRSKIISIVFSNRILIFFGKISYGFYVYHWPVYILLFPFFRNLILNAGIQSTRIAEIGSAVTVTVAGVIISVLSYRYFESFFLKLKNRFT